MKDNKYHAIKNESNVSLAVQERSDEVVLLVEGLDHRYDLTHECDLIVSITKANVKELIKVLQRMVSH